ncbi:hypothetical protein GQ457_06G033890 [Hibiscus cannabinus]
MAFVLSMYINVRLKTQLRYYNYELEQTSMAAAKPLTSSLHTNKILSSCNQISPPLLRFRQRYRYSNPISHQPQQRRKHSSSSSYYKLGSSAHEGGVGGDIIDFAEFRRRVGKKCTVTDSRAFYEFQERRGRVGDPLYVMLCCWLAAVGVGLLKSEEILEGVARLRISNDIEFEEHNFIAMMNEARERRAKLNAGAPNLPMEIRAEKALDAIYVCCFGRLRAVFPTVEQSTIQKTVKDKAIKVAEGGDDANIVPEPKPLSKEAVQMQMKDLEFLQQNKET